MKFEVKGYCTNLKDAFLKLKINWCIIKNNFDFEEC